MRAAARELVRRSPLPGSDAAAAAPPDVAPVPPHAVGLSDGRVLSDHPLAPHIILDGYCLLVTPRVLMGTYEPGVTALLLNAVRPGDTVIDIGANQGFHTLTMGLRVGPEGRVWAFEPHPRTRRILEDNVASNGLHHTISVMDAAAWSSDGELAFRARTGEAAGSYLRDAFSIPDDQTEGEDLLVRTVDTGAFLEALPTPPSLIKLDAEGSETAILRSAEEVLRAHHPTIVLEILPSSFTSGDELDDWERWLRDLGYEVGHVDRVGDVHILAPGGFRSVERSADVALWIPGGSGAPV